MGSRFQLVASVAVATIYFAVAATYISRIGIHIANAADFQMLQERARIKPDSEYVPDGPITTRHLAGASPGAYVALFPTGVAVWEIALRWPELQDLDPPSTTYFALILTFNTLVWALAAHLLAGRLSATWRNIAGSE